MFSQVALYVMYMGVKLKIFIPKGRGGIVASKLKLIVTLVKVSRKKSTKLERISMQKNSQEVRLSENIANTFCKLQLPSLLFCSSEGKQQHQYCGLHLILGTLFLMKKLAILLIFLSQFLIGLKWLPTSVQGFN